MTLSTGERLGPYEILEPLGAGGMGEVYCATDTKLGRDVAIKVLPSELAQDPDRLARFEREAKLLASLNHPNIAQVYGFESTRLESGATVHFLAMELVGGEDLQQRLERGPIPIDEALHVAQQVSDGLAEAHGHGIVHRDLKPANVKLTGDGKVKVLDFGLARSYGAESATGSSADLSQSPTLAHTGTQAGVILGTAAYMSPEQARGHPADGRADVWAFGVVLFEMLTGQRLFEGQTVSDILASVLKSEPDWDALPAGTPPGVRRLLRRCLAKDPESRLHHIADARLEIRDALAGGSPDEVAIPGASPEPASRTRLLPWTVAALGILLAIVSLWFGDPFSQPESRPVVSLAAPFPPGARLFDDQEGNLTISPTGAHLAVVLIQDGVRKIHPACPGPIPESCPVEGTENARMPFFSPDGRWLGFVADGKLRKVPVDGGTPLTICDAPPGRTAARAGASETSSCSRDRTTRRSRWSRPAGARRGPSRGSTRGPRSAPTAGPR